MAKRARVLVLALDIGSSSVRSGLFNESGARIPESTAVRKYSVMYGADGGAELDPRHLLRAARSCLERTLRARAKLGPLSRVPILAVAGSAMWHGLLALDNYGRPGTPIYTWADSRSIRDAAELRRQLPERKIQLRTGCMLRAPYWPSKLRWLRRTSRSLFTNAAQWVSPGTWIFRELFGAAASSHSMASGTGLYDLKSARWDAELCELCAVRLEQLGSLGSHCLTTDSMVADLRDATVFTAIGDGAAGNLGSGAVNPAW